MVATATSERSIRHLPLSGLAWLLVRMGAGWFWLDQGSSHVQGTPSWVQPVESIAGVAMVLGAMVGVAASVALIAGWAGAHTATDWTLAAEIAAVAATIGLIWGWRVAGSLGFDHWLLGRVNGPQAPVESGTAHVVPGEPTR